MYRVSGQSLPVAGAMLLNSRRQGGEQGTDFVVDLRGVVNRGRYLLAQQRAVAPTEAMDGNLHGPLGCGEVGRDDRVRDSARAVGQDGFEPIEDLSASVALILGSQASEHQVEQSHRP